MYQVTFSFKRKRKKWCWPLNQENKSHCDILNIKKKIRVYCFGEIEEKLNLYKKVLKLFPLNFDIELISLFKQ